MTQFIRYFMGMFLCAFTLISYSVDHIQCNLTTAGIPAQSEINQAYANIYTCVNSYPKNFPAIQLRGTISGDSSSTNVSGSCATAALSSGASCQFMLNAQFKQAGSVSFNLQIAVGSLYYLTMPQVTTTVSGSSTIPTKTLAFYNNSPNPIYPVIEAPMLLPSDPWLQAQFQITDLANYPFASNRLHRAYINGTNGIAPGQTVLVSVPFYSHLVANPSGGNVTNQYVDWWNAMRVYLYDVQSNLVVQYNNDSANPVTLFTPGPACVSGCSTVSVFSSNTIMPTNDPYQLTEYTFADVVTSTTIPYPIDRTHVDYDYSGVDQIYLPVAMEPYGSNLVGYTGTTMDLPNFRTNMNVFINDTGWPTYANLPYPRIPGAYNVVTNNPALTNTIPATTSLTNNWDNCVTNSGAENHANCVLVNDLFVANYTNCFGSGAPTQAELIQHIYGWVSFTGSCGLNPLADTTGYSAAVEAYHTLQYTFHPDYVGDFNPYVQLVHTALQMNVYAYSIDDAVGNINTIGDGVVMTIGGATGLTNPLQYATSNITTIGPGTPPPGSAPVFTKFGVCSATASTGTLARGAPFSFQLPVSSYPCTVTLEDSNNKLYQFILSQPAPFPTPPTADYVSCTGVTEPQWCSGVMIDFNTRQNIGTPPPTL